MNFGIWLIRLLVFNLQIFHSLCIMLKMEKIEKNLKQIFFSKSQNWKFLCIMLKIEKNREKFKAKYFFKIMKPETLMYYVENKKNRK